MDTHAVASRKAKYLCLTICGYRKPGMSEEAYRNHMVNVSAPMTKDLMVKHGIKRWTQIHNQEATRALMSQLFDSQMCNVADFDCFSQVVFESLEDYKRIKQDPFYKEHLVGDHENFADTKRSMMTIGWIEEFVRDGKAVDGFEVRDDEKRDAWAGHEFDGTLSALALCGLTLSITGLFWLRRYYRS